MSTNEQSKKRILWIDDEIELLRPHIILLQQKGYIVDTATNGEDAIELYRKNHFDLTFLDESMVGISGLDTLPVLKEIDNSTPVVMVTKNEAESVMEDAIGKKIDDYLTKPVNPAQIIAACKKFLESERIGQERLTQDYLSGFNQINLRLYDNLGWNDWLEIYLKLVSWSMELDRYPQLGFHQTLSDQWRECNASFSNFIERNYKDWITKDKNPEAPDRKSVV
jgi:CheY-like chemotaxis protein